MPPKRILCMTILLALLLGCAETEPANSPPVIDHFLIPDEVDPGDTVELQIIARDADGDPLTYVWEIAHGELSSTTERLVKWTAPSDIKSTIISAYVNDGVNRSRVRSQKVSINLKNAPPVIKEIVVPESVFGGTTLELFAEVNDPDDDPLTFKWEVEDGELSSETSEAVTWTAPIDEGSIRIYLTVNDGLNEPTIESTYVRVTHTLIIPGKQAAGIQLGDRFERVKVLYGEPEDRDGKFLNYWEIGLTFYLEIADFVTNIWIDEPNTAKTEGGVGPGSPRNQVIDEFGPAEEIKDGGKRHWYWKKGIQFEYAANARVHDIMIFSPIGADAAPAAVQDPDHQKQVLRNRARARHYESQTER